MGLIKSIWPFLRPTLPLPDEALLKTYDSVKSLYDELTLKIVDNDQKLQKLLEETPSCTSDQLPPFEL